MRKTARIISFITSAVLAVSCCGCDFVDALLGKDISVSQDGSASAGTRYDVNAVAGKITELQEIWNKSEQEDKIKEIISSLLDDVDKSYAVHVHAEMQYDSDWDNDALSEQEQLTDHDSSEVYEMVKWAFHNGYQKSNYSDLFEPYVRQSDLEYYLSYSLSRIRSSARSSSASSSQMMDSYYDTAYDREKKPEEINQTCAKLYLELLKQYDTKDYLYPLYNRDYSVEQASGMYRKIVNDLVPLYKDMTTYFKENKKIQMIRLGIKNNPDPFETLNTYAPKISESISESVKELIGNNRYYTGKGADSYDNCFTVGLPSEQSALMYIHLDNSYNDLHSTIHEFGHFHADWRDKTPIYQYLNCTDLAEVQSQGMELLFTHYYPEIYSDQADLMELISLYNIVDSIVSGFAVGEFEYEAMKNKDSYSASDVIDKFTEIHDTADLGIEFYQILHLFEQPGYYVSYGVSALAAMQIYAEMQQNFGSAVSKYERIAALSSADGKHQLLSSLEEAGFSSIFDDAAFERIIKVLEEKTTTLMK